ncbi:hypothetical protein [Nonomuraea diastatica]|uniref:MmyB family transcriptional regulator n=1 Tax=Nonomuraea diastatica TaxID=1848329 RepID=UPI00319DD5EA
MLSVAQNEPTTNWPGLTVVTWLPGRDPYNKDFTDLFGELSTRSDDFRARWAAHNVRLHHAGTKAFHHPDAAPTSWRKITSTTVRTSGNGLADCMDQPRLDGGGWRPPACGGCGRGSDPRVRRAG